MRRKQTGTNDSVDEVSARTAFIATVGSPPSGHARRTLRRSPPSRAPPHASTRARASPPSVTMALDLSRALAESGRSAAEEGPEMDGSEKALVMKLGISVMQVWHKNADKIWRCLSYETAMPSEAAKALMQF